MNRDESVRFATKYLEDLLSFFGINVAVWSTIDDQVIQLSVPSTSLNSLLIGKNAGNLRALQHIVSMGLTMKNAEIIENKKTGTKITRIKARASKSQNKQKHQNSSLDSKS